MMPRLAGEGYLERISPEMPPAVRLKVEFEHYEFTHVDIAAVLCRLWKLPDALTRPICLHHSPAKPVCAQVGGEESQSLLHAIAYFAGSLPLTPENRSDQSAGDSGFVQLAERLFGMTAEQMQQVFREAAMDFKATRDMFSHIVDRSLSIESILDQANGFLNEAVEDLVEEAIELEHAIGRVLRFEAGGMTLEMERQSHSLVTVYINDSSGKRLLSEEINPTDQDEQEIKSLLLLEDANEDEVSEVIAGLRRLAA